ncbi:MAG: tRNA uridine-5-carboxymethylaminomethyl(34) synthesis GTPase MnmE [Candidatus Omnitrophota bacterium]
MDFEADTIVALSTPPGRGGIAVIRVSGDRAREILHVCIEKWARAKGEIPRLTPRYLYHSYVIAADGARIDACMAAYFKGPRSYTGEDAAEISIHSNPFLIEEVLNRICALEPCTIRLAMPGEFTYRAFRNGKIDLLRAESVNTLIHANSRYFAHMAFGTLDGKLSAFMQELKQELIDLGVRIETRIEFEEDQFMDKIGIGPQLARLTSRLDRLLATSRFNDLLNKGLDVVIVGKVNVGKSSLFNTLLMEERSITSSIPGTTRDFIKEKLFIDGFPITLCDVAGINRETRDDIEAQGIRRSLDKIRHCDAALLMVDLSQPLDATDREIYFQVKDKKKIIIANKSDMASPGMWDTILRAFPGEEIVGISVREHRHIDAVTGFLKRLITDLQSDVKEMDVTVNQRQRQDMEALSEGLRRVGQLEDDSGNVEIVAEEIRRALDIIGRLMGEITPDDILNKLFSDFCVGK